MNYIKTESEVAICHGCLSTDRRLSPLTNYELYFILLEEKQRVEVLKKAYIMVCWECAATLNRFQSFRARVQRAHTINEETLSTPTNITLSHLGINIKDNYDAHYEETTSLEDNYFIKVAPIAVVKYESDVDDMLRDDTEIKVEKSKSNDPSKRRKTKKTSEARKRKKSFEVNVVPDLKVETIKNKSNRKSKKQEKVLFNVGNTDDKVEIKKEKNSDAEDSLMPSSAFDEPHITNDNSDSDYCPTKDDKETTKDIKRKSITFQRVDVDYSYDDLLGHFIEVKMSEDEIKSVLESQDETENKAKPNKCEFCGVRFILKKSLERHVSLHHKQEMRIKKDPNDPERFFLYQCTYCSRMVKKDHALSHLREFHKYKFYCLGCSWSEAFFWNKKDHANHWEKVHSLLECDLCQQTRRSLREMERHMRSNHLPVKCTQCNRTYSKFKYFRQHQKLSHPVLALEPPESRYCVECDLQCVSILAYKLHVLNQHKNRPKKRWPCPACDKLLNNKDTMKKHFDLFHSQRTRFPCPQCGKYLSSKCALQHHLNSHLNIKKPKDKLCSVCGRGFSTRRMLRFHSYTHTGERPYACPHCPAAFTQPNPLRVHARKQHPHLPVVPTIHPPS